MLYMGKINRFVRRRAVSGGRFRFKEELLKFKFEGGGDFFIKIRGVVRVKV